MKRVLSFFVALLATACLWAQNNVITYTANEQLSETTDSYTSGLHTNAFGWGNSISSHTFSDGVGTITFSNDISEIGNYAFNGCSGLISITIPEYGYGYITSIGSYAFQGCSGLTSITIPNSVTGIGGWAFDGCSNLESLIIKNTMEVLPFIGTLPDNCLIFVPASLLTAYRSAQFWSIFANNIFAIGTQTEYSITTTASSNIAAKIGSTNLQNVVNLTVSGPINSYDIKAIRENMPHLLHLDLSNANIVYSAYEYYSESHTENNKIGANMFRYLPKLKSIILPNNVTSVGSDAFRECLSLTSITIPDGVTSIGQSAFWLCRSLTSITIPESVTDIGCNAFYYHHLTRVNYIGDIAQWCSIVFRDIYANPLHDVYSNCYLYINNEKVENLVIPESVTSISNYAFAFGSGVNLASITCLAQNPPTISSNTFSDVSRSIPIYVPCSSAVAYQSASYWNSFTNIQEMECEPEEYTRDVTPGNYGTICLPKAVAHDDIQGGVFFKIVYAVTNTNDEVTGILMEEETEGLEAGKPYIFRATADELVLPYTGEAVAEPVAANGLVGNLSETPLDVPQGMYVLSNNQIRKLAGGSATAGQNRAYIDLTNVTKLNYVPAAAPNRVVLNVEGSNIATDLENIKSVDIQKVIRDGHVLILRDGKTYNVLGNQL